MTITFIKHWNVETLIFTLLNKYSLKNSCFKNHALNISSYRGLTYTFLYMTHRGFVAANDQAQGLFSI